MPGVYLFRQGLTRGAICSIPQNGSAALIQQSDCASFAHGCPSLLFFLFALAFILLMSSVSLSVNFSCFSLWCTCSKAQWCLINQVKCDVTHLKGYRKRIQQLMYYRLWVLYKILFSSLFSMEVLRKLLFNMHLGHNPLCQDSFAMTLHHLSTDVTSLAVCKRRLLRDAKRLNGHNHWGRWASTPSQALV